MSSVEEKLGTLTYKKDHQSHIAIPDADICLKKCKDKPCVAVCPAKVYDWDESKKKIVIGYENCIECGAARMICPFQNIKWEPPRGGFGVSYKFG
ncbi:MAG: 4Fe-4S ferredoxin [Elusimicrobia bacterium RIFCSPLOWO2_01_FULL_60_11]|nr:MAG: 4Fe-4S ferredoxin [Elusimicrobia bacterium RIFCSPLOWO2_01_FULL_60_11]